MAGIDLDVTAGPLEVVANLSVALDRMTQDNERRWNQMRKMNAARSRVPVDVRFFGSGVCPAGGASFAITIDGPQAGFYYLVRRVLCGGLTWSTAAGGAAEFYSSAMTGALGGAGTGGLVNSRPLTDIFDEAGTLPYKQFYSNHQVVVQPAESPMAIIVGGTAGQQYVFAIQVEVHRALSGTEVDIA